MNSNPIRNAKELHQAHVTGMILKVIRGAMMSRRVYRNALTAAVCREELKKNAGIMYDPALADVFIEHFDEITADMFPSAEDEERRKNS